MLVWTNTLWNVAFWWPLHMLINMRSCSVRCILKLQHALSLAVALLLTHAAWEKASLWLARVCFHFDVPLYSLILLLLHVWDGADDILFLKVFSLFLTPCSTRYVVALKGGDNERRRQSMKRVESEEQETVTEENRTEDLFQSKHLTPRFCKRAVIYFINTSLHTLPRVWRRNF